MSKSRDIADSAATINYIDTVTSNVQTQLDTLDTALDNISVTSGTLTKTFTSGESASISLTSSVLAPVVSVTKEVPQTGVTNNNWDVNSTTENYTRLDSAAATTLNFSSGLSGTTYDSVSFSVLAQESSTQGLAFNSDGTKMYVVGEVADSVLEYSLSTAFDVSTTTYSQGFSVTAQENSPKSVFFSPTGTKMFVLGTGSNAVNEYTLSTGFDVSTASYSQNFSVASQDTFPSGLAFNSDGTKMFVLGGSGQDVNEYALSTGFDVSTSSFVDSFSVSAQENNPRGICFNNAGTKMYIIGTTGDDVNEYTLSTSFDVSTASYSQNFSVAGQETSPRAIKFNTSETKMYIVGEGTDVVYQYSLGSSLALGTGSFTSADVGKTIEANSGVFVLTATDGSYAETTAPTSYDQVASGSWEMYGVVYNTADGDLELSSYSDVYNLASASYDSKTLSTSSQDSVPLDMAFNTDGTKVYMSGAASDKVYQYILSTAWDVSTGTAAGSFSFGSQDGNGRGIAFNNDGTKLYIAGASSDSIFQYSLSTAFNVTTASYDSISLSISSQETEVMAIAFGDNGSKFYLIGTTNNSVFQYSLTTPYAINTATYTGTSFSVNSQEGYPSGLAFSDDGIKMFVCGYQSDKVYLYNLTTAWDLSTASYSSVDFSVASQQSTPQGMALGNDGAKMYIVGEGPSGIFQYSIGTGVTATTGYQPVHTTASIDSTYWTDINSMTADQNAGDGNVYYAISTDDRTTWTVIDNTDGERDIVRNNAGTWQYNSNATYASETWVNGATNTELATLAEAMEGAVSVANVFDISTASYLQSFSVASQETGTSGLAFNADGTKMFICGYAGDDVNEYALTTGFDVSTASYTQAFSVAAQDTIPRGLSFNTDGTKMFFVGQAGADVNEYTLSTGFDVSTASFVDSFSVSAQGIAPIGLAFNTDGTKMFVTDRTTLVVSEYTLSTGFDVSTGSYVDGFNASAQLSANGMHGIAFNDDGTQMFLVGQVSDAVYQYTLTTGFDVSTASYSQSFSVSSQETSPQALAFSTNGAKMFVVGQATNTVYQYSVGTSLYTNQMDKTQLDAVTDPNHIALGDDLDLAIVFKMTSGSTVPSSDGVAINYDANVLNKGAVLGTDYDFDAPTQNSVRITALAGNNLKVRVV